MTSSRPEPDPYESTREAGRRIGEAAPPLRPEQVELANRLLAPVFEARTAPRKPRRKAG